MRAVIVDANSKDRRTLIDHLHLFCPFINVVAEGDAVPTAIELIRNSKPDILFSEIELPNYTGFNLIDCFKDRAFDVVFTCAKSHYVTEAFEVAATSYLLKPLLPDKLVKVVRKIVAKRQDPFPSEKLLSANSFASDPFSDKILIPIQGGVQFMKLNDLMYIKAEGSYIHLFMQDGTRHLICKKLKALDHLMNHPKMFRTHRSYMINMDYVKQFIRTKGGYIVMANDEIVSLARERKDSFLSHLNQFNQSLL